MTMRSLQSCSCQLNLQSYDACGRRYPPSVINTDISLYLRNRNCYVALRGVLALPNHLTIQHFFEKLESLGCIGECMETVQSVFSTLEGMQLFCKILVDEVTVQPAIRYRGNHLVGYAVDQ